MNKAEVEVWALAVIDRVMNSQPIEDAVVELKSDWTFDPRYPRQLAGQANAARGAQLLWLIGVDEKRGVLGADHTELSNWWGQVASAFDGIPPAMAYNLIVAAPNGQKVVALIFDTDRAPFVVKNAKGGQIDREVPWREATRTRSAYRSELLQLLVPISKVPSVDILNGTLDLIPQRVEDNQPAAETLTWSFQIRLYVMPQGQDRLVIPLHRCTGMFSVEYAFADLPVKLQFMSLDRWAAPYVQGTSPAPQGPVRLQITASELIFYGPAPIIVHAQLPSRINITTLDGSNSLIMALAHPGSATIQLRLAPIDTDKPLEIVVPLTPLHLLPPQARAKVDINEPGHLRWCYEGKYSPLFD